MNFFSICPSLGLNIIRIATGLIFIAHGSQKVFGLFNGPGLAGFAQWAATIGIPFWLSYAASFSELIGGILLLFCLTAPLGALLTAGVVVGAIWFVHLKNGFFSQNDGFEYQLLLLIISITIIISHIT